MAETTDMTLSLHGSGKRRPDHAPSQPALVIALECSRPGAKSSRHALGGVDIVALGRGSNRSSSRREAAEGHELAITIPDRWMSSKHARIEHSFGRWILHDAGSKNGVIVNGLATQRAVLRDSDIIELGHTLILFRDAMELTEDEPPDVDLASSELRHGLTTLVPGLARTLVKLERVAPSDIAILVQGESGTGKEVLARAIHKLSGRSGEFAAVNCGAIPANLVESELFGHKRGAFSGASEDRLGLIRSADGGTLLLDEIGDLPSSSQAALLRVLQEREVTPVGATKPVPVDIRLIAATHRDLDEMVASGTFRHDLFARIVGFRVDLPPLRQRREDLGLLVAELLARKVEIDEHPGFDCEAARHFFSYSWPLNIRELENCLSAAVVLAGDEEIAAEHLPQTVRGETSLSAPIVDDQTLRDEPDLDENDARLRDQVIERLRANNGNVSAVARDMGKDRKQIQRWLKRFKLAAADYK